MGGDLESTPLGCKSMRNNVYILGAGFSANANIPLTSSLLNEAINLIKEEDRFIYDDLNYLVEAYYKIESTTIDYRFINLSELLTILHYEEISSYSSKNKTEIGKSKIISALRYYLCKVIVRSTPKNNELPEFYNKFVKKLNPFDIVLSFNWDCLLEIALKNNGISFNHSFQFQDNIMVAKLHGSVNWTYTKEDNLNLEWKPIGLIEHSNENEIYFSNDLWNIDKWQYSFSDSNLSPLIVMPGLGKSFDVLKLSCYWSNLSYSVGFAKQIFILGLGLSADDFLLSKMLMSILPPIPKDTEIIIVNPDPYIRSQYSFLVGDNKAKFICKKLSEDIFDLIKE